MKKLLNSNPFIKSIHIYFMLPKINFTKEHFYTLGSVDLSLENLWEKKLKDKQQRFWIKWAKNSSVFRNAQNNSYLDNFGPNSRIIPRNWETFEVFQNGNAVDFPRAVDLILIYKKFLIKILRTKNYQEMKMKFTGNEKASLKLSEIKSDEIHKVFYHSNFDAQLGVLDLDQIAHG